MERVKKNNFNYTENFNYYKSIIIKNIRKIVSNDYLVDSFYNFLISSGYYFQELDSLNEFYSYVITNNNKHIFPDNLFKLLEEYKNLSSKYKNDIIFIMNNDFSFFYTVEDMILFALNLKNIPYKLLLDCFLYLDHFYED